MKGLRRTACLAMAALVVLSGCGGGDAPLGSAPPHDAKLRSARHADSGLMALSAGDYPQAEALATAALRTRADDPHALLALAMTYEHTGRADLARRYYQVIGSLDPQASVMIGNEPPRPVTDLARAGLDRLAPGTAEPPADRGRASANAARRFTVLRELVERGLATEQEYALRRAANIGALLPYSEAPAPAALDWPPPTAEQVAQRLRAIGQGLEGRSLTPAEHAAERQAILDALLPLQPRGRTAAAAAALDAPGMAAHLALLQSLRGAGFITPEELARERIAAERTGTAAAPVAAPAAAAPQPLHQGLAARSESPPPRSAANGPAVHLASLRTEKAARDGWAGLRRKFPDLLGKLEATFVKAAVPGKGEFWRITAGPLPDRQAADALCRGLKAKGQYCTPAPSRR